MYFSAMYIFGGFNGLMLNDLYEYLPGKLVLRLSCQLQESSKIQSFKENRMYLIARSDLYMVSVSVWCGCVIMLVFLL